ncbi:MAG: flagellar hook capping FlgD N-terminal domain-containing protein [Pseudomonadota bacterium]|nr:flagellar hook capping FlgD N-terminal domain-containing protein [Pseudomonadota bacterium]
MTATTNDVIGALGLGAPPSAGAAGDALGQEDFLRLLTTELRFQDPTEPLDSKEFLGQIAQFTSVDGIQGMQRLLEDVTASIAQTQVLQAAAVIGRQALAPVSETVIDGPAQVLGKVDLGYAVTDLEIAVRDGAGVEVATIDLGSQSQGLVPFRWDGTLAGGGSVAPGVYSFTARYPLGSGTVEQPVLLWQQVESVSLDGAAGPVLNVRGGASLSMTEVVEFG